MSEYDEDLKEAAEFREELHRKVLKEIRKVHPEIDYVIDHNPASSYLEQVWDYPGAWYTYVSIPKGYRSRQEYIDKLVKETLEYYRKNP